MIAFIKNYRIETIKKKFILLYVLNVTDIIFTVLLLQTGYFIEANILMVKAVQSPSVTFLLKIILPALLLYVIYKRMQDADNNQLKLVNIAVNMSLTFYCFVNLTHLMWTALLPIFLLLN